MRERIIEVLKIVGEFTWRGVGLFLFTLGTGAGVGGFLSYFEIGDAATGILSVYGGALLIAIGWVGYKITLTGKATRNDVAHGMRKAAEQVESQKKENEDG